MTTNITPEGIAKAEADTALTRSLLSRGIDGLPNKAFGMLAVLDPERAISLLNKVYVTPPEVIAYIRAESPERSDG